MKSAIKVGVMVTVVSLMAQFSFDLGPVPITGQTLGVLVMAALISPIEALVGILLYILIGALGAPIFADGSSGIDALIGNTAGYFVGFVVAAVTVSYLSIETDHKATISNHLSNQMIGTGIIMILGMAWLAVQLGLSLAIQYGFAPLWPGAVIKILIGSVLVCLVKTKLMTPSSNA